MKIQVLWTRTYICETDTIIEVPDGITQDEAAALVRKALSDEEVELPTSAASVWDGTGFVTWDEVDDDEEEVDNGLRGEIDE